jgi:hypothetical protein
MREMATDGGGWEERREEKRREEKNRKAKGSATDERG